MSAATARRLSPERLDAPDRRPAKPTLRPAPRREPPFDDEQRGPQLSLAGPFDQRLPFDTAEAPRATTSRQARPDGAGYDTLSQTGEATTPTLHMVAAAPTPRRDLPGPAQFARRFLVGVIEVATGRRPAGQLARHAAPAVQAGLARDAGRLRRLGATARPATLSSLHVSEPVEGVAEVAAVVRVDGRSRAIALRLEATDSRWRCVQLQIG